MQLSGKQLLEVCNRILGRVKLTGERKLSSVECARRLGLTPSNFCKLRPKLMAAGLRQVQVTKDGRVGYLESSLDALMLRAAEREKPIIDEKIPLVKIGPGGFARELNGSEPIVA